jgi:prevent-host-death family protein
MEKIGVRELRQNASRYLDRVSRGESLVVTDRGRPVARLVPIVSDGWEAMVTAGRVTQANDDTDVVDEAPADYHVDASSVLASMRESERDI